MVQSLDSIPRLWKMQLPASDHSWRIPCTMPLMGSAWVLHKVHEASWLQIDLRNPVQTLPYTD